MNKRNYINLGIILILAGGVAAIYPEPIYEYERRWMSPSGYMSDTPITGVKPTTITFHVGSYHPYIIPGGLAILLGVIMLVSAKSAQIMREN